MTQEQDLFQNEFDRQYGDLYRQGEGHCGPTNPENRFDEAPASLNSSTSSATVDVTSEEAKELAAQLKPKDLDDLKVFAHSVLDFVNTIYPEGPSVRHRAALKLFYDFLILFDGNAERARRALLSIQWVQDIVSERGMSEIDRIVDAGQKLLHKRESENFNDPQPSKEMQRAIEHVCGRKYKILIREVRAQAIGQTVAMQEDILHTLNRIGREIEKLFPQYPLLKLLCHRQ